MSKNNVININTDKPCLKCGAMGALDNGLCMTCATNKAYPIGEKTINAIKDQVEQMLRTYLMNLNGAYRNEEKLIIGFSSIVEPGTGGDLIINTKINFVESRVKDELEQTVNEAQQELFSG